MTDTCVAVNVKLLGDVQSSLDGGEGIPQKLFEENQKLEAEVKELELLLKQVFLCMLIKISIGV